MSVCCATSSIAHSSALLLCRHNQVTRRRACRSNGKGLGEEGILSDVVPVYLYSMTFSVSVSLGV